MIVLRSRMSKPNSFAASRSRVPLTSSSLLLAAVLISLWLTVGCSFSEVDVNENTVKETAGDSPDPVILVDRTGKEWDVTTAVHKYGFKLEHFEYGLGPFAIRPIIDGDMLDSSMKDYPTDDMIFPVIGVSLNGDIRGYGIHALFRNEVADEYIGGVPVAVAY